MYLPLRVVLADDHEIFRRGFRILFEKQDEIELVDEAENGKQLLEITAKHIPDVVITDIQMPLMDGIEACRLLQKEFPDIPVIALSTFNDDHYIIDMLEAGARGYILKNTNRAELIHAVKAVTEGNTYYCSATSQKLAKLVAESRLNHFKEKIKFTEREIDIIKLICREQSNKEIASKLNISVRTVESHRERIQEKIGSRNVTGITIYAIRHKICEI